MTEKYYLSSLDSARLKPVRECELTGCVRFRSGKEAALVKVFPGVVGQDFGVVDDLEHLVVTNRHEGEGLFPITSFPCFVFVCRPLVPNIEEAGELDASDVEIIGWGELYRSRADAEGGVFR